MGSDESRQQQEKQQHDPGLPETPSTPSPSESTVSEAKRLLWEAAADGLRIAAGNLRAAWYTGDEAVFYKREEQRLKKYLVPVRCGIVAFAVALTGFRLAANPGFRRWRSMVWERVRPVPPPRPNKAVPAPNADANGGADRAPHPVSVLTDVLVSLGIGVSGTLLLMQTRCANTARVDCEEAPLVAGRSLVADSLCPGLLGLYASDPGVRAVLSHQHHFHRYQQQQQWTHPALDDDDDNDDATLQTFATLVRNCQRRKDHEARLRRSGQPGTVLPSGAIVIPHTGVQ